MKTKCLLTLAFALAAPTLSAEDARWWKGHLHPHPLWSAGADSPSASDTPAAASAPPH